MKQVLKQLPNGDMTFSHFEDDNGNVVENVVIEQKSIYEEISELKEQNIIIMMALADLGGGA